MRVEVNPKLLEWAIKRAGDRDTYLYERFPRLADWIRGEAQPTLKQLENFAKAAYVSVGYLFLRDPPEEKLPIPDLRTVGSRGVRRPSPDLLDVIYLCQRRQSWYQDYAESVGEEPRRFVGSAKLTSRAEQVAAEMRDQLGFKVEERRKFGTWEEARRQFIAQAEDAGVLVMVSSVVGSNSHRKLDPDEFRGFDLADKLAPLVFINGADTKAAQMFTLAHELAHIWLGQSALSDVGASSARSEGDVESWCNRVAAEMLVPQAELRRELGENEPIDAVPRLAKAFKVSTLVILRRLLDAAAISRKRFDLVYAAEVSRLTSIPRRSGGDYYATQPVRLSRRFAKAVITSTLEGQTLYRDAFQMLGMSGERTFRQLGRELGVLL